jgi:hypothetical protein
MPVVPPRPRQAQAARPDPEVIREEEERQQHAVTAWMALGMGIDWGAVGGATAAAAALEGSIAFGHHLISLRYTYLEEDPCPGSLLCLGGDVSVPHLSNQELSVQYGWAKRLPARLVHGSVGPAAVWTLQRGSTLESQACFLGCVDTYNAIHHLTVGAAGEAGVSLTSSVIGIGPTLLFDLNPVQSSWGVVIDLYLGWIGRSPRW